MTGLPRQRLDAPAPLLCLRSRFGPFSSIEALTTTKTPIAARRGGAASLTLLLIVVGLWVLLNARYGYHLEDSVLYLPIAKQQIAPALYPDNPLIEHLRRMPYPLYKSMGWLLATPLGVDAHVAATVAMRLAFVGVLFWFMTELTGRRWAGILASLASILQPAFYGTLAWTELISPEFVQSDLGKIVLMAAVIAYLRGRLILTAAILGVGFNVHPIFSVATAAMLVPDAIWRRRRFGWRIPAAVAVGALLAAPTVVGMLRSLSLSIASPAVEHAAQVRFFNYFHVFPSLFHRWEYVKFLGPAGAGVVAFALLVNRLGERRGTLLRFALGIGLWCLVGVAFVEWAPHTLVMQMMPFRVTVAVRLLATGLIVAAALDVMQRRSWASFTLAAFWLATVIVSVKYTPWATVIVAAWSATTRRDAWSILATVVAIATAGLVIWIDPYQLPSLQNLPWAAAIVVGAGLVVLHFERTARLTTDESLADEAWPFSHAGRIAWIAVIVAAGMVTVAQTADGVRQIRLAAGPWQSPAGYDVDRDPWQGVMQWARSQTEPDDAFITPPDLLGWTCYAERNTLVSYQLGMQSVWDRRYAPIARGRLADLGVVEPWAPGANYHAFPPDRLRALARAYDISYIVWKRSESSRMPWPVVHENDGFLVYDVRDGVGDETGGQNQ